MTAGMQWKLLRIGRRTKERHLTEGEYFKVCILYFVDPQSGISYIDKIKQLKEIISIFVYAI